MLSEIIEKSDRLTISTGNVLNINKKAGQKANEELFDCLKATLKDPTVDTVTATVRRTADDLADKINEYERANIKIGAKVYLNDQDSEKFLTSAIDKLFSTLPDVKCVDNLILAYHPRSEMLTNGSARTVSESEQKEGVIEWGKGSVNAFGELKKLWSVLEEYATKNKICQIGIADLDTETLMDLFKFATVKPTIAQINLSACCIVPPALQEFCAKNDIQLLTHSDPEELITKTSFVDLGLPKFHPTWTIRYQVHVKCRGVLAAKGFISGASLN